MPIQRLLKRGALICGLALYSACIAEACVRLMNPQALMPRYITGTPWGVRGNIPNAVYHHKTPEVDIEYRINSQGMRADRDFPFAKSADVCRIALFGDSFFVGYELDIKDTVATQVEKKLQQDGYRVELLNFSVSGFGTAEMLRTYERYARQFDPDLVIFQWHSTDPDDNVRSDLYQLRNGELVEAQAEYLPSVATQDALMNYRLYRLIADNSQLYAWVRERVALFVKDLLVTMRNMKSPLVSQAQAADVPETGTAKDEQENRKQYELTLSGKLLQLSRVTVRSDDRSFMVVDIPDPYSRTDIRSSWSQLPLELTSGINVVHAMDALSPLISPDTKLFFEKGHGHLTPKAADALAELVAIRIETVERFRHCQQSAPGK